MGGIMLNFNLVKRAPGPVTGNAADSADGNVNLPARDAGNETQSTNNTGGEED